MMRSENQSPQNEALNIESQEEEVNEHNDGMNIAKNKSEQPQLNNHIQMQILSAAGYREQQSLQETSKFNNTPLAMDDSIKHLE